MYLDSFLVNNMVVLLSKISYDEDVKSTIGVAICQKEKLHTRKQEKKG